MFKALADPSRRFLLDLLFARDGRPLSELVSELEMTRFGVAKHLGVLEAAGLVVARRSGREKLHFLYPVPIHLIHDRWIDKFAARQATARTGSRRNQYLLGFGTFEDAPMLPAFTRLSRRPSFARHVE